MLPAPKAGLFWITQVPGSPALKGTDFELGPMALMKVLVCEGLDGERRRVVYCANVYHPLVQLGEDVIVASNSVWRRATSIVLLTATHLLLMLSNHTFLYSGNNLLNSIIFACWP